MRRWGAVFILLLITFYLGAGSKDRCDDSPRDGAAVCHILCADGCATAPVPVTPVPPSPDPLPRERHVHERAAQFVSLDIEPEKTPPRS